ncbi:hypothetical protein ABF176_002563 [Flavobacterium psychrophilum]
MKVKKLLLIFSLLLATISNSQITTTKIEVKEKIKELKVYDGKSDFEIYTDVEDYRQYIGQKIYTKKSYAPIYTSTGEVCNDYQNKYFTIKNVKKSKIRVDSRPQFDMQTRDVFELTNDENGEIYYYRLDDFNPYSLILVPYFLNLKKAYENKKYVIVSYWREDGFTNEATNEWVVVDKKLYGGEWDCEVSVVEKDGQEKICYIMKSNAGEIISSEKIDEQNHSPDKFSIVKKLGIEIYGGIFFMSVEDYNAEIASKNKSKKDVIAKNNKRIISLTQKYGKEKGVLIANGKVALGMNKEMCKESWGIPLKTDVEKTKGIIKETFIYGWSKRLHFENNKLVKIEY